MLKERICLKERTPVWMRLSNGDILGLGQAGAQSLVMSMWSVPDKEIQELMVQFYKNIAAGMNRSQALRQSALKQMQIAKERHGHAHPLYWGAFVFLGES